MDSLRQRAAEIESALQRHLSGLYPIRALVSILMGLMCALSLLPDLATVSSFSQLIPALLLAGSLGTYTVITFLVWEKWDVALESMGAEWIGRQKHKPRTILLLVLGQHGLIALTVFLTIFRFALLKTSERLLLPSYQGLVVFSYIQWVLLGVLTLAICVLPTTRRAFEFLVVPYWSLDDDTGLVSATVRLVAAVQLAWYVLRASPSPAFQFVGHFLASTLYFPYFVAGFYGFVVLWLDSVSQALEAAQHPAVEAAQ